MASNRALLAPGSAALAALERDFALLRSELVAALARASAGRGDPPRKPKAGGRPR